jgi:hypothetical protein
MLSTVSGFVYPHVTFASVTCFSLGVFKEMNC